MREIVVSKKKGQRVIALLENGILLEKYEESEETRRLEGNIYLGKVQNVLQGMQAAFIDIGENKNTFIHLKDLLPKVDERTCDVSQMLKENNIKNVVKPGMPILVQVKRDSTNKKGARVSTHISINSRFIVLMPNTTFVTISQKIENQEERKRLLAIVQKVLPHNTGAIIRTSAQGRTKQELEKDIKSITEKWEQIQQQSKKEDTTLPRLVYQNDDILEKFLLDVLDHDIQRIFCNDKEDYEQIKEMLFVMNHEQDISLIYEEQINLLEKYNLFHQLEQMKNRKIWLKCGGFITIDKTEALTAIDVNSGKYIGNKNLEQTVFTVNKEATIEIAKQLRLRDIGGIIIIDYIDMQEEEHEQKIIELLEENLKQDRSKTQVLGFTKLNLLEMTRKHMCSND